MLAIVGIFAFAAMKLPVSDQIPVHWNAAGDADQYSGRTQALIILAAPGLIMLFTNIVLAALPFVTPRKNNVQKSAKTYLVAWIGANVLVLAITALLAFAMIRGVGDGANPWMVQMILSAVCLFLIAIGNVLPKSSSNWFVGVRTPWTLSSDYTWTKTHRLAGWLFVLSGIIGLPFALMATQPWLRMLVVPLVVSAGIVSVVYSLLVWRNAPDRA